MEQEAVKIISNTLSNIYDWESNDLRSDFIDFLSRECSIDNKKLGKVFDSFESLPPLVKESVTFRMDQFVLKQLS